jgi:DedD protein
MEDKNGLNDIILKKNNPANNNKKIILAVATLGIILIIVVVLMNSLSSNGNSNLPQPILPDPLTTPDKKAKTQTDEYNEPLFEDVEVVEDDSDYNQNLSQIAQKLKEESLHDDVIDIEEPVQRVVHKPKPKPKTVVKHTPKPKHVVKKQSPKKEYINKKSVTSGRYYIQVGSFSRYTPNKRFLKSITDKGYSYKYHKVTVKNKEINKILVGPFKTEHEARKALKSVRKDIVAGAFLTKI